MKKCHDCGVNEGQLHKPGCGMERCPFCGGQLISCDCVYNKLGLIDKEKYSEETAWMRPDIFENGLSDDQWNEYEEKYSHISRVPYISYPILCAKCGKKWPDFFKVENKEWEKYIEPDKRSSVICLECYSEIKKMIDNSPFWDLKTLGGVTDL